MGHTRTRWRTGERQGKVSALAGDYVGSAQQHTPRGEENGRSPRGIQGLGPPLEAPRRTPVLSALGTLLPMVGLGGFPENPRRPLSQARKQLATPHLRVHPVVVARQSPSKP